MRSASASQVILVAAAVAVVLLVVLEIGVCSVAGGSDGGRAARASAVAPVLGVSARARLEYFAGGSSAGDVEGGRMLGGAGGDYGFVDPPPDTHRRRGGTAPIPHN